LLSAKAQNNYAEPNILRLPKMPGKANLFGIIRLGKLDGAGLRAWLADAVCTHHPALHELMPWNSREQIGPVAAAA